MAESKFDLSKVTFEDVLAPQTTTATKQDDVVIPAKTDVVNDVDPVLPPRKEENEEQEGFYEGLQKLLGYEVDGEFDESVEGVAEYAKAVGQKIAEEEVKDLFESFPDVKEYLQFRLNNGDPAKFFEAKYGDVDYSKYNVTETDEVTQETVIRKYLLNDGYKQDQIEEIVKDYKDTGLLYKQAKRFADKLVESQASRRNEISTKQAEEARIIEAQREQLIGEMNSVIEKGNLHNIIIPDKDRKEFKAWLLQPDQRGQTRRQVTMSQLSLEQKLQLEYLAFKGFDLKDLVKKEATQTKIDFLKKGATTKGSRLNGTGVERQTKTGNALSGLKLSDLGL
jgi:hypothetical protein